MEKMVNEIVHYIKHSHFNSNLISWGLLKRLLEK